MIQLIAKEKKIGRKCLAVFKGDITKCTIEYVDKGTVWLKNVLIDEEALPFSLKIVGFTEVSTTNMNKVVNVIGKDGKELDELIEFLLN